MKLDDDQRGVLERVEVRLQEWLEEHAVGDDQRSLAELVLAEEEIELVRELLEEKVLDPPPDPGDPGVAE